MYMQQLGGYRGLNVEMDSSTTQEDIEAQSDTTTVHGKEEESEAFLEDDRIGGK